MDRISASVWALTHNVHSSLDWMLLTRELAWALHQTQVPAATIEPLLQVNSLDANWTLPVGVHLLPLLLGSYRSSVLVLCYPG